MKKKRNRQNLWYGSMPNFLLKMKLLSFLIFVSVATVTANSYSQQTKFNMNFENVTVRKVFQQIEENSEFILLYSEKSVDVERKVNVEITNQTVDKILDQVFMGTKNYYEIHNRQIAIMEKGSIEKPFFISKMSEADQQKSISGKVTDYSGGSLPGVSVVIKGTTTGTITDSDGNFTFTNVPASSILQFSFVGMKSQEIKVGTQTSINVVLAEEAIGIEEVVAVGYGTVKKSDLTSAISTVKGEQLENRISIRLDEALQGQLSGVTVQQSSGIPGAAPRILVRGVGSINAGNNPLYVVDGFPLEDASLIANIDGSDIESIEVLKDAASAAIYGSRGANGVVIVTTKKGKAGKVSINLSSYWGIQSPERLMDFLNAEELGQIETEARNSMWVFQGGKINDPNEVRPPSRRIDPAWTSGNYPDYDKQDFLFSNNAPIQNYTLSASGGNDKSKYFMSMNYLDQEGITRNTGYERIALRTNLESQFFSDKVKIGLNLNPSWSVSSSNGAEGKDGNTNWILWSGPLVKTDEFYFDYKKNQVRNDYSEYYNFHPSFTPRFLNIDNVKPTMEHFQLAANSYLEIELLEGLKFKTSGGILYGFNKSKTFVGLVPGNGTISRSLSSGIVKNWLWENTLNYSKTIDKHSFNLLAGYTSQKETFETFNVSGRGYKNELSETLNNATEIYGWGEAASEWSMISMLSRLTYNYDSRYLFTTAIRRDGSSRFGINNQWGIFPSLSVAWNIHKEKFWTIKNETVSNLKLRLSWGKTGNNRIGNYASVAGVSSLNAILGVDEKLTSGYRVSGLENSDLGWETTNATNVGLDMGFWNDRLNLTLEYYNNKTTDLLLNVPIPEVTGFTNQLKNIGSVRNSGLEFDLISRNIVKGNFTWTTRLNFFTNKNEVLEMGPEETPIITGDFGANISYTGIGHPIGAFYMHRQLGIFQNQAEVDASATVGTQEAGDVKLNDLDGDGDIDGDDREFVGQPQPKYNFGITNEFKYKNFDLSFLINGAGGNEVYFAQGRYFDRGYSTLGMGLALTDNWNNRWRSEENPGDGKTPSIVNSITGGANYEGANGDGPPSTRWLYDGDFWRLQNITLGYTLPKHVTQIIRADNLRFYFSGDYLFLKTNYVGYNPQVNTNTGDNYLVSNFDYGSTPLARKIVFGFNLTF